MRDTMDCSRAQELLSDHYEGALDPLLSADLEKHLASCPDCRALREALAEVVEALRSHPVLEPPAGLDERAAAAALASPRLAPAPMAWPRWLATAPAWPTAAALVVGLGLGLALTRGTRLDPSRTARRFVERSVNAGAYLMERKDRLMEDVRLLRVVISTAFEGRLDRVNDRVDDYRKLLERRRATEQEQQKQQPKKNGAGPVGSAIDWAGHFPGNFFFENPRGAALVQRLERTDTGEPRGVREGDRAL